MPKRSASRTTIPDIDEVIEIASEIFECLITAKNKNGQLFSRVLDGPDMKTIQNNITAKRYDSLDSFISDMEFMVNNKKSCYEENSEEVIDANEFLNLLMYTKQKSILDLKRRRIDFCPESTKDGSMHEKFPPHSKVQLHKIFKIPDVDSVIKNLLRSLLAKVRGYKNEDGRILSLSMMEKAKYNNIDGKSVEAISFDTVEKRLNNGEYKRLDEFQDDMFYIFERARRLSQIHSITFNDSKELQRFFIDQRDIICQNTRLQSPALNYTKVDFDEAVDVATGIKAIKEQEEGKQNGDGSSDIMLQNMNLELRKREYPVKKEIVNVTLTYSPHESNETQIYFEQYIAATCLIRIEDYVFVENLDGTFLVRIASIFTDEKKNAYIYGSLLRFPDTLPFPCDRTIYEEEVFLSSVTRTFNVSQIVEKCAVLPFSEYTTCRPLEISEDKVFVCRSMYEEEDQQIVELPIGSLKKTGYSSHVRQDEILFFGSDEPANNGDAPGSQNFDILLEKYTIFRWSALNNVKERLINYERDYIQPQLPPEEKEPRKYVRHLLYEAFIPTTKPELLIDDIAQDLTIFKNNYCLRLPNEPVIDIVYSLLKSKHETKNNNKPITKIIEKEEKFDRAKDYPLKVPIYVSKPNADNICDYQPIIVTTSTKYSSNAGDKIYSKPPHEPTEENPNSSNGEKSPPYHLHRKICYKLMNLGHTWTDIVMGREPFSGGEFKRPNDKPNMADDLSDVCSNHSNSGDGNGSSIGRNSVRYSSQNNSGSNSKGSKDGRDDARNKKGKNEDADNSSERACQLAMHTTVIPGTGNVVTIQGDSLYVDTFIVCENVELCRWLSATFGIIFLDEILLNFQNLKGERNTNSKFFSFKQNNISSVIDEWWQKIMIPEKKEYNTLRMVQSRYAEYLSRGFHNIALTCCSRVVTKVEANSYGAIRNPDLVCIKHVEFFTCITVFDKKNLFLSGIACLTKIINRSLKFKASVPVTIRYKKTYYEIELSLISIVPFYILRRFSVKRIEKEIEEILDQLDPLEWKKC